MSTVKEMFPFGGGNRNEKETSQEAEAKDPTVLEVETWRRGFFKEVLSKSTSDDIIETLVSSTVSPHDVVKLRNMECPDDLIVKILI